MLEVNLTSQNFDVEVLKNEGLVLVDFFATWCGPCKMIAPILTEIANEYKDKIKIGKVNVDEEMDLSMKYKIESIPTLVLFKDGKVINTLVGFHSKSELLQLLNLQ